MKKINILLLLVLGMFLTSCTKDFEDGGKYNGSNPNQNIENGGNIENGNNTGNNNQENGVFKATIGGNAFVANSIQAIVNDNYVAISGLKTATGELIQITLRSNKVGTYTIKNDTFDKENLVIAYAKNKEWVYAGLSNNDAKDYGYTDYVDNAILKITAIDTNKKTISGTFQFTGVRVDEVGGTKQITNGSFTNIPYTQDAPVLQPDNKFSAKIDGKDFVATNVSALISMNKIMISGIKGSVESIGLFLPNDIKEGTYTLGTMDTNYSIRYNKDMSPGSMFDAKKGSIITILKHDKVKKTINGTFSATEISYTTSETHEITEGSFSVSY